MTNFSISSWMERNTPDLREFIRNFFKALNNKSEGHSLRKWLAIGFFWLIAEIVIKFTDASNLVTVVTILCGMITSLVITYTVGNIQEKKLENANKDTTTTTTNEQVS